MALQHTSCDGSRDIEERGEMEDDIRSGPPLLPFDP